MLEEDADANITLVHELIMRYCISSCTPCVQLYFNKLSSSGDLIVGQKQFFNSKFNYCSKLIKKV